MMEKIALSVIIPAKNEKNNIVPVINALKDWVDEIFVVDSQSTDGMPDVVAELAKDAPVVEAVKTAKAFVRAGLEESFPMNQFVGPIYHKALAKRQK